jgi:F-type H+-transporting ATPase subunit epsilon
MSDETPATIHLTVVTPDRLLAEADAESVSLPSLEGEFGILPGHRPLFVGIGRGQVRFRIGRDEEAFSIRGGYAQVQPEKVVVVTDVDEDEQNGGVAAA